MGGNSSLTAFIGTVSSLGKVRTSLTGLGESVIHMSSEVGKNDVVAVFCRNDDSQRVHDILVNNDFQAIVVPESVGLPSERIAVLNSRKIEVSMIGQIYRRRFIGGCLIIYT